MPAEYTPAYDILHQQRWSIVGAARELGIPITHFGPCIYGKVSPRPEVREKLPKLLGVPLEELFSAETLARPYDGRRGPARVHVR